MHAALAIFVVLEVLEVPMSWRKCSGGFEYQWIGITVFLKSFKLGLSESRAEWVVRWTTDQVQKQEVSIKEFSEGLGRLGFATSVLEAEKPFLAPLYSFVAVNYEGAVVPLPLFVTMNLIWIATRVKRRRAVDCAVRRKPLGQLFRVDAKAEGDIVAVGGWAPARQSDGSISKYNSPWFSMTLDRESAPWAFSKGEPYKVVMSLEATASLCGLMLLGKTALDGHGAPSASRGAVEISAMGDSRGGSQAMQKGASTRFPLCVVLMELAVQKESLGLLMDTEWAPRYANEEADALSNGVLDGFAPERRRGGESLKDMKFIVLEEMMALGERFYREAQEKRAADKDGQAPKARKRKKGKKALTLRQRDPW